MAVVAGGILLSGQLYNHSFMPVGLLILGLALLGFQLTLASQRRSGFEAATDGTGVH